MNDICYCVHLTKFPCTVHCYWLKVFVWVTHNFFAGHRYGNMFGTYQQAGEDSYHKGSLGGMNPLVLKHLVTLLQFTLIDLKIYNSLP